MQAEVFFLYHNGEQRGPYTAKQVNHWHRCGFVDDDTLYWREGLEQWQPISQIVLRRRRRNRLLIWSVVLGIAGVLALLVWLFGPVTADAWRELTSGDFTEESAWWRSRGLVRDQFSKSGTIQFDPLSEAQIALRDHNGATVNLGGTILHSGGKTERAAWRVVLRYDADRGIWMPAPKAKSPATPP